MDALIKVPKHEQEAKYRRLLRGKRDDQGPRHNQARLRRLAKHARDPGARLRGLERTKCIVLVSRDFEEILENTVHVPRSASLRTRCALAEAMAQGYCRERPAPEDEG